MLPNKQQLDQIIDSVIGQPGNWCTIPAGEVILTDMRDWLPTPGTAGGKTAVSPFFISRYPITNRQYAQFLQQGYADQQWWAYSAAAQTWRQTRPEPDPTGFPGDMLPRTQVSWYDAVAFCQWVTTQADMVVRLPTAAEWQWAAAGDTGWLFPYGPTYQVGVSNTEESRMGHVTAVDQYPEDVSPFGVMGLASNVSEWCLDNWYNGSLDLAATGDRTIRGGSFYHNTHMAEVTRRWDRGPDNGKFYLGFRLVTTA